MKKEFFQKDLRNIISNDYRLNQVYQSQTSGSSGHPFYFAKDKFSHAITHALIIKNYQNYGLSVDDKQARFYGIPISGLPRYKEILKDKILNRVRFPVFDLSNIMFKKFLSKFYNKKFIYVYGYTSAIALFAKYLISRNIILRKICPTLKYCIVTSEVCTSEDKYNIEYGLGIKVINEYGASELGIFSLQ